MLTRFRTAWLPTTSHAIGIHLSSVGMQAVWLSREPGQAIVCRRVWSHPTLDVQALLEDRAWARGSALHLALDEGLPHAPMVRVQASWARGLSWRDRRFQQTAEVLLQHPDWDGDWQIEEAQGQVWALDAQCLLQWRAHARALGLHLREVCATAWLHAPPEGEAEAEAKGAAEGLNPIHDGRMQEEAQASAPVAWRVAHEGLHHASSLACLRRPNWALTDAARWAMHLYTEVQSRMQSCLALWRSADMSPRQLGACVVAGLCVGAVGATAFAFGLQALGQWRDDLTQVQIHIVSLQEQQRVLLQQRVAHAAQRDAQHQRDAEQQQAWQPMRAHSQTSLQWVAALAQAQGVWLQALSMQPTSGEPSVVVQWRVRGEALSPAHAHALAVRLQALPIWHTPPTEHQGQWVHGQDGRLSVWAFELRAQWMRPW